MNWPTTYYAFSVPMLNVWVVTASDDTGEMHGFLDVALGWSTGQCPPQLAMPAWRFDAATRDTYRTLAAATTDRPAPCMSVNGDTRRLGDSQPLFHLPGAACR
jgi:hypothetical protein